MATARRWKIGFLAGILDVCGSCAASAPVELAAADSLDVIRQSIAQSIAEYHADLAEADEDRQRAVVAAFIVRIRADHADETLAAAHAEAFAVALTALDGDRQAAWRRYTATLDNLDVLRETGDDLCRMAIQSLSLEDETKRYFSDLLAKAAEPQDESTSMKEGTKSQRTGEK